MKDPNPQEFRVTLNGEPLAECVEADEEAGRAMIIERDYRTGERIPGDFPGEWQTLEVRGKVEIRREQAPGDQAPEFGCGALNATERF